MVKKFLLSTAVIGALATSAMAYDVFPQNEIAGYDYNNTYNVTGGTINLQRDGFGKALIMPLFYAGNGWSSTFRIINTANYAVVAKVVLYAKKDSKELADFNVYLSAHDELLASIIEENGQFVLKTTDSSAPLEGNYQNPNQMADANNPLVKVLGVADANHPTIGGYIQVIGMAKIYDNDSQENLAFDGQHQLLRQAYKELSLKFRERTNTTSQPSFTNGVVIRPTVIQPFIELNSTNYDDYNTTAIAIDRNGDHANDVLYLKSLENDTPLIGDIRITNTNNRTDMDIKAQAYTYQGSDVNSTLIYLEGEKANLADIDLNSSQEYDYRTLVNNLANLDANATNAFVTYGDADNVWDNSLVVTIPFKRAIVQEALKIKNESDGHPEQLSVIRAGDATHNDAEHGSVLFTNVSYDNVNHVINSYGSYKLLASIYDNEEHLLQNSQLSPANTAALLIDQEVTLTTSADVNDQNKLPFYIQKAKDNGFNKGYMILENINGSSLPIFGILSQMRASTVNGQVTTTWLYPQAR